MMALMGIDVAVGAFDFSQDERSEVCYKQMSAEQR
jgi:hypothetical protein